MDQWSGFTILHGTFRPYYITNTAIVEIELLPAADSTAPSTVLQQAGRGRLRLAFKAYVTTIADYNALLNDYRAGAIKQFVDVETGIDTNALIMNLGEPDYRNAGLIMFDVEMVEA